MQFRGTENQFSLHCVTITLKKWDYTMIFPQSILLAYALGHEAFRCHPRWFVIHLTLVLLGCAFNITMAQTSLFARVATSRLPRLLSTSLVVICYLFPPLMAAAEFDWRLDAHQQANSPAFWAVCIGLTALSAGVVWFARFPERIWPKKFDTTLHSHACMHLIIAVGHLLEWMFIITSTDSSRGSSCG